MTDEADDLEINEDALQRIQNGVLDAEETQLSYRKPHDIIPELETIIEEEIRPEDVPRATEE